MNGAATVEGNKRCLPLWMVGVASADGVSNSNKEDGLLSPVCYPESKKEIAHLEEDLQQDADTLKVNQCVLAKCERRRKRKCSHETVDSNNCVSPKVVQKSSHEKKRKAKKLKPWSVGGSGIPSSTGDGEELHMEDIMTIAEEYVRANNHSEQPQSSNRESEFQSQLLATASNKNESAGSPDSLQCKATAPTCEATHSAYDLSESVKSGGFVSNMNRTGDPAQDMLDLFLGPLLKKPIEGEMKAKYANDMNFSYELKRQHQSVFFTEELGPLIKKKSSLKETVAVLLD